MNFFCFFVDRKENRQKILYQMLLVCMCLGDICLYDLFVVYRWVFCKCCRNDNCKVYKLKDFYDFVVGDGKWLF